MRFLLVNEWNNSNDTGKTISRSIYNEELWEISIIENPKKIEFDEKNIKYEAEVLSKIEKIASKWTFDSSFDQIPVDILLEEIKKDLIVICDNDFKNCVNKNEEYFQ